MPSFCVDKAPLAVRVGHEGRQEGEGWAARGACAGSPDPTGVGWCSGVSPARCIIPFSFLSPGDDVVWASTEQPVRLGLQPGQTVMVQRTGAALKAALLEPVVRLIIPAPLKRRGGECACLNFLIASDLC